MEWAGKMTLWVRGLPAGAQGPEFEPLAPILKAVRRCLLVTPALRKAETGALPGLVHCQPSSGFSESLRNREILWGVTE